MTTIDQVVAGSDLPRTLPPLPRVPQERYLATEIPGPRSRELMTERRAQVSKGFGAQLPVFIDRADGGILLDVDGNRIIDLASGLGPTALGASNERVRERLLAQLDRFTHTCFMTTEYESYVEVCRWLNERAPGDAEKRTARSPATPPGGRGSSLSTAPTTAEPT